jgi:hypothetical protein
MGIIMARRYPLILLAVALSLGLGWSARAAHEPTGPALYLGKLKAGAPRGVRSFKIIGTEDGRKLLEIEGAQGSCRYELSEFTDAPRAVVHTVRFAGAKAAECKPGDARKYVSGDFSLQRPDSPGSFVFYDDTETKDRVLLETAESGE